MIKTSPFFKSGKGKTDVALRKLTCPVPISAHKKVMFWIREKQYAFEEHIKKIGENKSKSVFHVCSHVGAFLSGSFDFSCTITTFITALDDRFTNSCTSFW